MYADPKLNPGPNPNQIEKRTRDLQHSSLIHYHYANIWIQCRSHIFTVYIYCKWLRLQKCCVNGHLAEERFLTCGVPQGSIIGPLLFLVYINDLPSCLKNSHPRMYADDTSITIPGENSHELQTTMQGELSALNLWLKVNKLSLNVAKTEFMIVSSRQKLEAVADNHCINLNIEGKIIKRVDHAKSLGRYIDKNLSWSKHIEEISKKISSGIGALKRIRPFISQNIAVQIYKALVEPHFEYCSPVWHGINNKLSDKLQKLQNRAARAITQSNFDTSSSYLRNLLVGMISPLDEINNYPLLCSKLSMVFSPNIQRTCLLTVTLDII